MIPTLLALGMLAGLLPMGRLFVIVAAVGWPLLLVATEVGSGLDMVLGGALLGAANAAVGILFGRGLRSAASWMTARIN